MNNMNQMGKSFEMYTGDYAGYYPGYLVWDPGTIVGYPPTTPVEICLQAYIDRDGTARRVFDGISQPRTYYAFMHHTLGTGYIGAYGTALPPVGGLRVAPYNLGTLLATNMLPDEKAFYCPSGMDVRRPTEKYGHRVNDTLGDWKQARQGLGGADAGTVLMRGAWPRYTDSIGVYDNKVEFNVTSQYGYRNAAIFSWAYYAKAAGYTDSTGITVMPYTNPPVKSRSSCPPFKTTKILGGRALVSDDFWKGKKNDHPIVEGAQQDPGYAAYVHRDGYNVLYGDGSGSWYGDADQKIIYWDVSQITGGYGALGASYHWLGGGPVTFPAQNSTPRIFAKFGTPLVWHMFDDARGIDSGVAAGVP